MSGRPSLITALLSELPDLDLDGHNIEDLALKLLRRLTPIAPGAVDLTGEKPCLVIVDLVRGFCEVGAGNLAPQEGDEQNALMIRVIVVLARIWMRMGWPIIVPFDCHPPGMTERPFIVHCERGSGEEKLVTELAFLYEYENALFFPKDCNNAIMGAYDKHGGNKIIDFINVQQATCVVAVGKCSDICLMDFVLTFLSARNQNLMPSLYKGEVYVVIDGTATYDLPRAVVEADDDMVETMIHPQMLTHYFGLYLMSARGAVLTTLDQLTVPDVP